MKNLACVRPVSCQILLSITFATVLWLGRTATAQASLINGPSNNVPEIIPEMHYSNVPLATAIEHLAGLAGQNCLIDPKLFRSPGNSNGGIPEPDVDVNWTNLSAGDALARLLKEHGLVSVRDSFTTVAFITGAHHVAINNLVDVSLFASADPTNEPAPMIVFEEVPLDDGLKHLLEHDHLNVVLDPKVAGDVGNPVPVITIHWKNLTAKQAVVALCRNYGLTVVKDAVTGVVTIKPDR